MPLLSEVEINAGLEQLNGWILSGREIRRSFEFETFGAAIAFVNRVATAADEADHHPDIDIRYSRVQLSLSTHSAGGLTERDLRLASRIDDLAG